MNPDFLREAIRLSLDHMKASEGGPFGAVVARGDEIISRGWNRVTSTNDPTAHAEVVAIRDACLQLQSFALSGCDLYASCEPCPMCLAAAFWSRVDRIYYAASQEDAAAAGFDDQKFYQQLALPPQKRIVRMEQHLRDEAKIAFDAWRQKADRIVY
jgi:tRNA(Arg) A34 adenosine deaminase TadA